MNSFIQTSMPMPEPVVFRPHHIEACMPCMHGPAVDPRDTDVHTMAVDVIWHRTNERAPLPVDERVITYGMDAWVDSLHADMPGPFDTQWHAEAMFIGAASMPPVALDHVVEHLISFR